ncbi:MAG: enoyl-CoA hydratase [Mesorhizobium sp.]|nr:enoyl-CoA hydratase [Mesorhizobium sp.]MCO5161350.1 enoyl-CoA hydratase [Mesorhizobium sp.]
MEDAPLLVDVEDGIATLTLNRPEALNSLNAVLRQTLVATLRKMDDRDDVAVIILTGKGRAFCAGLDVKELAASGSNVAGNVGQADIGATITALKKPIIAAINGLAVTGGFEITLACDIVLAAQSAYFQDTHAKIGLLPGWGLSQRLPRTIGLSRAKEISLSARKVPAEEAARLGFVSRVVADAELIEEARTVALSIAQWQPAHIRHVKALMDKGFGMPLAQALEFEAAEAAALNAKVTLAPR